MERDVVVPDYEQLNQVQELCEVSRPYEIGNEYDQLFVRSMVQSIVWHRKRCFFYDKLLEQAGFSEDGLTDIASCAAIPFLHANFFKTHEILSIDRAAVYAHLTSSGTTGQKSQMFFDRWSLTAGQRMVDFIYQNYDWATPNQRVNYLLYAYQPEVDSKLGTTYTDQFLCKYAPVNELFYALRLTGQGSHEFDVYGCIRALQRYAEQGLPVRISGFPSFLYFTVERMKAMGLRPLKLSPDSLVMLGGGWKGYAEKQIPKRELYALLAEQLGIPDERCRDGFGSVEHSIPYVECANHNFHVPVWSRVFIRDVASLAPLKYGQEGFLQFVTPFITSVPAISVMMGDLAVLHPAEKCGCGLSTPYFEIVARAGTSKNKSCAIAAAELLRKRGV